MVMVFSRMPNRNFHNIWQVLAKRDKYEYALQEYWEGNGDMFKKIPVSYTITKQTVKHVMLIRLPECMNLISSFQGNDALFYKYMLHSAYVVFTAK